jgi:hypothetical protein
VVSSEDVIRMSDPEASWCHVSVKKTERSMNLDNEIVLDQVLCLCCIFNKEGVSHCVVSEVLLNSEVVYSVESNGSVISSGNGVPNNVGVVHSSNHMEMDGVSTELESLTDILKLDVTNFSYKRFITRGVEHDLGSILIFS